MAVVEGKGICFSYEADGPLSLVLNDVNITVDRGELVALLGHNGCGKSTLVKHFNSLLPLQKGSLTVSGIDTGKDKDIWQLRRLCGMVFQNPDNQFVSSVVEEDIAFGLENYQVPREEIPPRVRKALEAVGMSGYEKRSPHSLSGGQKQRIALAGVLALEPDILVFDEVTAMLDPRGRREVLDRITELHRDPAKTIFMISHFVEEAVLADRVLVLHKGRVAGDGPPGEILTDAELLNMCGLIPPVAVRLYYDLLEAGIRLERCPLTEGELVEELCQLDWIR